MNSGWPRQNCLIIGEPTSAVAYNACVAILTISAFILFAYILIFVLSRASKLKHNASNADDDLSRYIRSVLKNIDHGMPSCFDLRGNVKFEVALKKASQGQGAFRVEVVEVGGKYCREELSKISFEIGRKHFDRLKPKRKKRERNVRELSEQQVDSNGAL